MEAAYRWNVCHVETRYEWAARCRRCMYFYCCGCDACTAVDADAWRRIQDAIPKADSYPTPIAVWYCMLLVRKRLCPTLPRDLLATILRWAWADDVRTLPLAAPVWRLPCCGMTYHSHCMVIASASEGSIWCAGCKVHVMNLEQGDAQTTYQVRTRHALVLSVRRIKE